MFGCPKAQLKQSAPSGTGPSVKAADVFLPLGESSAQPSPFKPEGCTCSTDGEGRADSITAGTKGTWLDLAAQCIDDHPEQDLLSTSQTHLFTANK